MNRLGCRPGFIPHGSACKRIEIPAIGHGGVPSVENRAGCKAIGGHWMDDYGGVCIMENFCNKEGCYGYTAPIKGVVVGWHYMDFYEAEGHAPEWKDMCGGEVWAEHVEHYDPKNKEYYLAGTGLFDMNVADWYDYDDCAGLHLLTKDLGLSLARNIKTGDVKGLDWRYVNPKGRPVSYRSPDAVVTSGENMDEIEELYRPKRSFSFRGNKH